MAAERLYSQSEDVIRGVVAFGPSRRVTRETVLILTVLTAALAMRIVPICSDLPYFSSLDEVAYIETALRFGTGAFQLSSYFHGALYQLILFLDYGAYFVLGRMAGLFESPADFLLAYLKDPTSFFLLARLTAALSGVGVVGLSYAVASRVYTRRVGLVASLFTAFSLLMFQMSVLAVADIPSVFLLMVATYFAVRSVEQPADRKFFCAAAAFVGLAAACKYLAGLGVVIVYAAAFVKGREQAQRIRAAVRLAILASVFAFVGFCVGIPQALLDPVGFYKDVFLGLGGQYVGYDPGGDAWLFVFTHHLRNGLGIPLTVASLMGVGFAIYTRSRWDVLLLSFPLSFYLLFAMRSVGFAYHLLPAVPFVLILAARFVDAVAEKLWHRQATAASLVLAAAVVAPTFLDAARLVQAMRTPNTKVIARAWIEQHIPEGSTIMAEGYVFTVPTHGPPLVDNRLTLERDIAFVQDQKGSGRLAALRLARYDDLRDNATAYDILKVSVLQPEAIASQRPRYLVMTSEKDMLAGKELAAMFMTKDSIEQRKAAKEHIRQGYTVLARIEPTSAVTPMFPHLTDDDYRLVRNWPFVSSGWSRGPTITIWERRSES